MDALGLFYSTQLYTIGMRLEGMDHSFWRNSVWQLQGAGTAIFSPPRSSSCWEALSDRRSSWRLSLPVHIIAFTIISLIHSAMVNISTILIEPIRVMTRHRPFWDQFWGRGCTSFIWS